MESDWCWKWVALVWHWWNVHPQTTPFWAEFKPSTSVSTITNIFRSIADRNLHPPRCFFDNEELLITSIKIYYATVNCWWGRGQNLVGLSWSIFKHVTCWHSYCHKVLLRQSKSVCFLFVNVVRTTIGQERWVLARCCGKSQTWKNRRPTSALYSKALLDVASWMVFY